jgi:hypothetical protein
MPSTGYFDPQFLGSIGDILRHWVLVKYINLCGDKSPFLATTEQGS